MLTLIFLFNSILDPYGYSQWTEINNVNTNKFGIYGRERGYRGFQIRREHPDVIVLGTSRAAYGISMKYPYWHGSNVRNLAMSGATTKEMLDQFTLAASSGNLKTAIIGLDLFSFNKNCIDSY